VRHGILVRAAIATLARLLPASHRPGFAGDLLEELALRERESPAPAARLWLLRQVARSVPPLVWCALARTKWLSTLSCAFVAYVAVGLTEFLVNWALSGAPGGGGAYRPLGMVLTFPAVAVIAWAAATYRRGAPWVLGAMMLLAVTVMTLTSAENLPTAYRVAYFIVGPLAVTLGAALRGRSAAPRQARTP